jgi:hypothetical protein
MKPGQASGVPYANRNAFVDGRFDVWQAASGAMPVGGYGVAPLWLVGCGQGGAGIFGQADARTVSPSFNFDSSPRWAFQFNMTTASTGTLAARTIPFIQQRVESVFKFAGRSATFSIKLWTNVAGATINVPAVLIAQSFGSGGSPSPSVILDKAVNWVITTKPTRFSVRIDFPSISGKTIGTNNNDAINVGVFFPGGSTYTVVGCEAQLELCDPNASNDLNGNGGDPTTFEWRGDEVELAMTQRYWTQFQAIAFNLAGATYSQNFPQHMRATPTLSLSLNVGSGAVYSPLSNTSFWMQTPNSVTATATITADARL